MAMMVRHNAGAQLALFEMNMNNKQADNALTKLTTGEKFLGVNGDSASYAISEKMLEQIRSLMQDDQNIQNGASMIKTAERGVDQIVQNLRTMKELAIDAANDSNTDEDRHTIQKELDQCRAVINDIALGTRYNGKILLDGRYTKGGLLSVGSGSGGANTTAENVIGGFRASADATSGDKTTSGEYGTPEVWQIKADSSFKSMGYGEFSVELNFSDLKITKGSYPTALHNQGFTILCDGCPQYINIRFDATKTAFQSQYDKTVGFAEDEDGTVHLNDMAREFIIGVQTVRNAKDLANAIFDGISSISNQIETYFTRTIGFDYKYISYHKNSTDDILVNAAHDLRIRRAGGKIYLTKNSNEMQFKEGTIPNPLTDPIEPAKVDEKIPNPLWVQHGTRAGQRMHVYVGDMQEKSLGIDKAEVTTQENATSAIGIIESAIEMALDEATNLGAYLQRFEYTGSNVTTMTENVQASESTIRDADMAKELTEYMKYNLLSQSSQAMLSQANQNGEFVLGMLRT